MLLIPVFLQFAFLWGSIYIGLLVTFTVMGALAATGGAYGAFIETVTFILNILAGAAMVDGQLPASVASPEALSQTIAAGVLTWQALVVGILIGLFVLAGAAAAAYTKALALGVIDHAVDKRRIDLIGMFRAGRKYWRPVFMYYAPFALLLWLALLIVLPLITYLLGHLVATQGMQSSLPAFFYVLALLGALFLLLRMGTVFVEGIVLDGSRRPVRDSLNFTGSNVVSVLKMVALLTLVAIAVYVLNEGISWVEGQRLAVISLLSTIVGFLLYAFWRLWVAAFVVSVWRSRNLKQRMPRAS